MRLPTYRGWGLLSCVLLAACPGDEGNTGSATATTTSGAGPTTEDGTTSTTGPATSTGDEPTAGGETTQAATGDTTTSGTTGATGDPQTDCEAYFAELVKQTDKDCTCQVELGDYPDHETCLAEYEPEPVDCLCPIFVGEPANDGWLACTAVAAQHFTACLAPIACDDFNAYAACSDAYFDELTTCGMPTKPTLGQTDVACYNVPAFMCTSGESVPFYFECDMEPDCMDMSDESEATCTFMCGSGEKIPKDQVCDEDPNCMDMSDETAEMCKFTCGSGEEILKSWVCDMEPDCMDGSDEAMCLATPLKRRATGSWSAGTRPTRGRTASPSARAAAWPTR